MLYLIKGILLHVLSPTVLFFVLTKVFIVDQAPVSVDSERSSKGVMVTGRGNRVAVGTEQQVCKYLV